MNDTSIHHPCQMPLREFVQQERRRAEIEKNVIFLGLFDHF
jgi:hypothetical protein